MNIHRILTVTAMALLSSCAPIIQESGNPSVYYGAYDRSQGPTTELGAPLPQTETRTDYPYAEKTSTPGIVISPHAPYNVMDVNGLRPGSLALDQSTNKKFRVP